MCRLTCSSAGALDVVGSVCQRHSLPDHPARGRDGKPTGHDGHPARGCDGKRTGSHEGHLARGHDGKLVGHEGHSAMGHNRKKPGGRHPTTLEYGL